MTDHTKALADALEELMEWQVKHVKRWHNSAYDNASRALAAYRAALTQPQLLAAPAAQQAAHPAPAEGDTAADWVAAIAPLMPADFKDWHENNPKEWPRVTAEVIKALRESESFWIEQAGKTKAQPKGAADVLGALAEQVQELIAKPSDILAPEYATALREMAAHYDMSEMNVLRAAIRLYQAQRHGSVKIVHKREPMLMPKDTQAPAPAPEAPMTWYDGPPPFPQDQEWFIAETIYGDKVALIALEEGRRKSMSWEFKTADGTYLKRESVKRWMQFPDCMYLPPAVEAPAVGADHERDRLRAAQTAAVMLLIGPLLDAWEQADREVMDEEPELVKWLTAINAAMETAGDEP